MSAIKVYAVREKGTNNYLPSRVGGYARNYSSARLEPEGGEHGPRVFGTKKGAQNCLSAWSQGEWLYEYQVSYSGYEDVALTTRHRPERNKDNLEVVEFHLTETVPSKIAEKNRPRLTGVDGGQYEDGVYHGTFD